MAPSSSICVSFFTYFDENANVAEDNHKSRNKRIDREVLKQKHRKLAKIKERAYATSLDDLNIKLDSEDDLDVMARVELMVKDELPTGDLIPEFLKVSKDELINGMLHLVSRVCACDKKIAKLENSCDALLIKNEKFKRDVFLGDKQLE